MRDSRLRGGPEHGYRELVRTILRAERQLKGYRPTARAAPEAPGRAPEALEALGRLFRPGDPVGLKEIRRACKLDEFRASALRRWARAAGRWPYSDPPACRPAGKSDPGPRRGRKGGKP